MSKLHKNQPFSHEAAHGITRQCFKLNVTNSLTLSGVMALFTTTVLTAIAGVTGNNQINPDMTGSAAKVSRHLWQQVVPTTVVLILIYEPIELSILNLLATISFVKAKSETCDTVGRIRKYVY